MKIEKLLIANRGEIALRIMRSARSMGYTVVAIFSDNDRNSAYVKEADECYYLPGNSVSETYLNIDAIIKAAKDTSANAIHPGYGFLSENSLFAGACEQAGIIFVGPSSEAIKAMGNKITARDIAKKNGVPIAPGITGNPQDLIARHTEIGFPMLVKAAAGGGGKGMRIVRSFEELEQALRNTSSEALNYFGDGTIYIEKYLENPRHIEVQILGDKTGNVIHLFERECSVQRRHQKIIEEAPSPSITPEVRHRMCEAAIKLVSSINYYNAGTVEFLVDNNMEFFFLEMNTRIQVEHPVTEMITGVDIVKEQFRIAQGEPLSYKQSDLQIIGHAIELRIYAEDPENNFMPSPGTVLKYHYPGFDPSAGSYRHEPVRRIQIRVDDSSLHDNSQVSPDFDPMISKVIASGKDRNETIKKLLTFLPDYQVTGIKTNLGFLQLLLNHEDFINNGVHTRYIDENYDSLKELMLNDRQAINENIPVSAAIIYGMCDSFDAKRVEPNEINTPTIYREIGFWRIYRRINFILNDTTHDIILTRFNKHKTHPPESVSIKDLKESTGVFCDISYIKDCITQSFTLYKAITETQPGIKKADNLFILIHEGERYPLFMAKSSKGVVHVRYSGRDFAIKRLDVAEPDDNCLENISMNQSSSGDIISPMPGKVLSVLVEVGDEVKKGDLLMVIEAMKMENNILAPYAGTVDKLLVNTGEKVDNSSHLVHLIPSSPL